MINKFDRMQIASINEIQSKYMNRKGITAADNKKPVPEKETFRHILGNALKGNEMAAVLLDEWQKNCEPRDNKEQQVYRMINKAANKIFK